EMILILTEPSDGHADRVAAKLRERGTEFFRFDPAVFPVAAEFSTSFGVDGSATYRLFHGGTEIDLAQVTAVWIRRPGSAIAHPEIGEERTREFVQGECNTFISDVWNLLECRWVPARWDIL